MDPAAHPAGAFTLIELLIVMSIMAVLASMLSVMMTVAQRQGRITNTKAVMMQVDQAIRLFRTDMKVYPWQTDVGTAPAEPAAWGNNLAWRLAWSPPEPGKGTATEPDRDTYIANFQADIATINRAFAFVDGENVPPRGTATEGTHAFRNETRSAVYWTNLMLKPGTLGSGLTETIKLIPGTATYGPNCAGDARKLTKMAEEYAIMAYTSGQMPVLAPVGIDPTLSEDKARFPQEDERYPTIMIDDKRYDGTTMTNAFGYVPYNKQGDRGDDSRGPVLTTATARALGWRGDYLAHALRRSAGDGCHQDVGADGTAIVDAWGTPLIYICTVRQGVRGGVSPLPISLTSTVQEERYGMNPRGRKPTGDLDSDVRVTADPQYVLEFELWSAGPDGKFAARRSEACNADNIAVIRYQKGLK